MSTAAAPVSKSGDGTDSPCLICGACCAAFRVSFYWAEASLRGLAESWTEKVNPWLSCMAGTNGASPRCEALAGPVGEPVHCRVYAQRPSPCREVLPGDEKCLRARARYGLEAL